MSKNIRVTFPEIRKNVSAVFHSSSFLVKAIWNDRIVSHVVSDAIGRFKFGALSLITSTAIKMEFIMLKKSTVEFLSRSNIVSGVAHLVKMLKSSYEVIGSMSGLARLNKRSTETHDLYSKISCVPSVQKHSVIDISGHCSAEISGTCVTYKKLSETDNSILSAIDGYTLLDLDMVEK